VRNIAHWVSAPQCTHSCVLLLLLLLLLLLSLVIQVVDARASAVYW
jgi:hypothetical protein